MDLGLPPCVLSVWGATPTTSSTVLPTAFGTVPTQPWQLATKNTCSYDPQANPCASIGNAVVVAPTGHTTSVTSVPAVFLPPMELKAALALRHSHPVTPYDPAAWESLLHTHGLLPRYRDLPLGLRNGFDLHLPTILNTQTPPNRDSLSMYSAAFDSLLSHELRSGRYIGPFAAIELQRLIGPFQSSPISVIPKSGKPGKYRIIQNFSFPLVCTPSAPNPSINSTIDSDDFPCFWGTFDTVCTIIRGLPPGSQAATRDVAEAYRTIPLLPSQWPAAVVQIPDGRFCIDTCTSFGMGPSAGAYGHLADGGVDLLRAQGLGPITKWVDDHLFFRIRRKFLDRYNIFRQALHAQLSLTGLRQTGGRIWYEGTKFPDGSFDIFSEDCAFPILDLSSSSVHGTADADFSSSFAEIDRASSPLGIPWESTKDSPFAFTVVYIGLFWSLPALTVELAETKKDKYRAAITNWHSRETHVLLDVQQLYGKLLHSCLVVPAGRAYLTSLESMLAICGDRPFVPHHPVRHLCEDLDWWFDKLSPPFVGRTIPVPVTPFDIHAFSDASSTIGIGVVIAGYWRAWSLHPGWQTLSGCREIGWAEAVGFQLLATLLISHLEPTLEYHFLIHCDNVGVVDGWRTGRSRNWATNGVFRQLHSLCDRLGGRVSFHLQYVASGNNPADGPSRGLFPSADLVLPPIPLPDELKHLLTDISPQPPNVHSSSFLRDVLSRAVAHRPNPWDDQR
jgi:hypothetical protein